MTYMNNLIGYPLALALVMLLSDLTPPIRTSLTLWILCGIMFPVLYIARCKAKRFLSFIMIHLAVLCAFGLLALGGSNIPLPLFQTLSNSVNRFAVFTMAVVFVIYSIRLKMQEVTESNVIPMPLAVGVFAVTLFLQHYLGNTAWDSYYIIPMIVVLALYFIYSYLIEYTKFLVVNASSTGVLPEREIFYSGLGLAIIYSVLTAFILLLTSQYAWLKGILRMLRQVVYTILSFIFSLFPKSDSELPEIVMEETYSGSEGMVPTEAGEPALIWQILEVIAVIGIIIALSYLVWKGLCKLIAHIKYVMSKNGKTWNHEYTGVSDVREKCQETGKTKKHHNSRDIFHFPDARERIRRIYKKRTSACKPVRRLQLYTAKEMEQEMNASPFAEIYEKARYSTEECTGKDVKRMKEMCRYEQPISFIR